MKVFLGTVGCRLNQAEIESMARQFRAAGHDIVAAAELADIAIVNTCSVTAQAASDSRSAVRRIIRSSGANVIATGCWATLEPELAAGIAGVRDVVLNGDKDALVSRVLQISPEDFGREPIQRDPLPGPRRRTRAFIKVQDGCDNRCSFCVTGIARGPASSRLRADVLRDVHSALAGGAREIVITGVHLGSWGHELGLHLADLVKSILQDTDVARLRLSSLEPWDLHPEFFVLWRDGRLCPQLHLPLQSGSARTLRRMARKTTPARFRELVAAARAAIPGVAITTDLIAGFPGETDSDFQESLEFVQNLRLAGGHSFSYSAMPGTAAARMPDQVRPEIRKDRSRRYISALETAAEEFMVQQSGTTRTVLWERFQEMAPMLWEISGLTDNYVRVHARSTEPRWNMIDHVELRGAEGDGMLGIIRKSG